MATTPETAAPALPIVPTRRGADAARDGAPDLRRLRARLHAPQGRRGRAAARAVGRAREPRLPGREPPGGVRRRRPGDVGARRGRRGDHGQRVLAAADRRLAGDRRQHPRAPRQRGAEGPLAARHRRRHDEDRVRDHRAGRGLELAQPHDLGAAVERQLRAPRREDLHLGGRGLRRDPGRHAGARRRRQPRPAAAVHRRLRRPGPRAPAHPDRAASSPTSSGRCSSTTSRCRRTGSWAPRPAG